MAGLSQPKKSAKRVKIIDDLAAELSNPKTAGHLGYHSKSEGKIATAMCIHLELRMRAILREIYPDQLDSTLGRKATESVLWEGSPDTTINMIRMLGTQHRPDFVIQAEGMRVAVELKRGESGSDVRDGLGQSIVYAHHYDFVIYCFVDTSKDGKIRRSLGEEVESALLEGLWDNYNIRFVVV